MKIVVQSGGVLNLTFQTDPQTTQAIADIVSHLNNFDEDVDEVLRRLHNLQGEGRTMAGRIDDINALVEQINNRTNEIGSDVGSVAARIQALKDQIENQAENGLTPEQAQDVVTQLGAVADGLTPIADQLTALASDPANPVPPIG